jgi:hypothetical protein
MAQSGLDLPEKDYYFRTDQKSVEREELVKQAFPQLGRICENRGVSWGEVDLRWGITDEASAEGKVLPLRLSEIQRCGWFIGLLGDRYGWVPEEIPLELLEAQPGLHEHRGDLPRSDQAPFSAWRSSWPERLKPIHCRPSNAYSSGRDRCALTDATRQHTLVPTAVHVSLSGPPCHTEPRFTPVTHPQWLRPATGRSFLVPRISSSSFENP